MEQVICRLAANHCWVQTHHRFSERDVVASAPDPKQLTGRADLLHNAINNGRIGLAPNWAEIDVAQQWAREHHEITVAHGLELMEVCWGNRRRHEMRCS